MPKNQQTVSEGRQISYRELLDVRKEEMERDLLPGFLTTVKDPRSNKLSYVQSGNVRAKFEAKGKKDD